MVFPSLMVSVPLALAPVVSGSRQKQLLGCGSCLKEKYELHAAEDLVPASLQSVDRLGAEVRRRNATRAPRCLLATPRPYFSSLFSRPDAGASSVGIDGGNSAGIELASFCKRSWPVLAPLAHIGVLTSFRLGVAILQPNRAHFQLVRFLISRVL
jgi:hypothetical protein